MNSSIRWALACLFVIAACKSAEQLVPVEPQASAIGRPDAAGGPPGGGGAPGGGGGAPGGGGPPPSTSSPTRTFNGSSITIGGLFCGITASSYDGLLCTGAGSCGLAAGKSACETACSSTTAHLCAASEIAQSLQVGMSATIGGAVGSGAAAWIFAGGFGDLPSGTGGAGGGGGGYIPPTQRDCNYFTDHTPSTYGIAISGGNAVVPVPQSCGAPAPIACCD